MHSGMIRLSIVSAIIAASMCMNMQCLGAAINVKDFGAVADGKTDDTPAFKRAMEAASKTPGSFVYAPLGQYLIAGTISVSPNTTLTGDFFGPGGQVGTTLLATGGKGKINGPGCIVLTAASSLKGMVIKYPDQNADADEPIQYPYAITGGPSSRIEDVFMLNPYLGINLDECHLNLVRNVWGEPLRVGINADHCYDISRIENVHFWPYFTLGKKLRAWVQSNAVAFQFGRSDWQYVSNTFCYGYKTGYRFYKSVDVKEKGYPGGTTNGNFNGIGADCVKYGVDIEDSFVIGVSITNGEFGPFAAADSRGIIMRKGNTGNITMVNCNFWAVIDTLAEVQDGSLNMTACNIHEWAVTKKEVPCFVLEKGRLNVNGCTFNKGGYLAILEGTESRATFAGNMGTDPLTVVNRIGDKAVFSANNPKILKSAKVPVVKK